MTFLVAFTSCDAGITAHDEEGWEIFQCGN